MKYAFYIFIGCAVFYIVCEITASLCVFIVTFCRTKNSKWSRTAFDGSENQKKMYAAGEEWRKVHEEYRKCVCVENDGLKLYGEYYDFGFKKCVFVLLGRSECIYDSFYFVKPYVSRGFNVLAVDSRAHGNSDGVIHTFGKKESSDCLKWIDFLKCECGIESVVIHGICVGASAGVYALTSDQSPDCVIGIVCEGMHVNLAEHVKNHTKDYKMPRYPLVFNLNFWFEIFTGCTIFKGPYDVIDTIKCPILFLQSMEDKYSLAEKTSEMFDKCGSPEKYIRYFEHGSHSMIRISDESKYDVCVGEFLDKITVQQ